MAHPTALYLALLYSAALRAVHVGGHHGDPLGIGSAVITCYTRWDLVLTGLCHRHVIGENWIIFPLLTVALVLAVWRATGHPLLRCGSLLTEIAARCYCCPRSGLRGIGS